MKRLLPCMLLVLLLGCESEDEFGYSFAIAKSSYSDATLMDSITYYYDTEKRLVHVNKCLTSFDCREHHVTYESNVIQSIDGSYYLNDQNQIVQWIDNNLIVEYQYDNDHLVYERQSYDTILINEHFYTYDGLNLVKDSGIYYGNSQGLSTTYLFRYTDTIVPVFLIGFSGLFESPLKHRNLIRECESTESGSLYRYSYDISENTLIECKQFFDTFHEIGGEVHTTKYYYLEHTPE